MTTQKDKYLAELQQLLAAQQIGAPALQSSFAQPLATQLGNNWETHSLGILPNEAAQFRSGIMADGGINPLAEGLGGDMSLSPEAFNQRYRLLTKTDPNDKRSGASYLIDTQDGNKLLGSRDEYNRPWNVMKDFVIPAALVWGGGYLASSMLGGAAAGGGLGDTAALGLDQVGALEGAGGLLGPIEGGVAQGFGELGLGALPELGAAGAGVETLAPVMVTGTSAGGGVGGLGGMSQAGGLLGGAASLAGGGGTSAEKNALYGGTGYGPGMTGGQTQAYDQILGLTGNKTLADMAGSQLGSTLVNGASSLLGNGNLGNVLGGLLGAATSKDTVQTQSRDPWAPAQPYLKNLLADAEKLRAERAAQPFSPRQTAEYNRAFALNDRGQAMAPGLLDFAQQMQNGAFSWQRGQGAIPGGARAPAMGFAPGEPMGGLLDDDKRMTTMPVRDPRRYI